MRVGFVGVGVKGSTHVGNLLRMEGVELQAVCDIVEQQCVETQAQAERLGKPKPAAYFRGDWDFRRMCESEELDLVYTATPWRWHTPVMLAAMNNGSHAATEVPAAVTLEECWELVETAEKTGKHCVMMENVNYQRIEMAIWRMVREGVFGEVVHNEGSYLHDTRWLKANDFGDGLWLGEHHARRNGCLYPTHGIGPLAWYLNLGRGDRMEYLVSMSSNSRGCDLYMQEHLPAEHPKRKRSYANGDVNTCLIRTASGVSIEVKHDTDLPRPYSRGTLVQGTRGIVRRFPEFKICLEGDSHHHKWESGDAYSERYEHPLWKQVREESLGSVARGGHGPITKDAVWDYDPAVELRNGDFLEDYRLIEALRTEVDPDFNVYDAAAWSAIAPLSEQSVANRSVAVDFPDFTKGKWKTAPPLRILGV
ncbi:Gfo/Idh/MocA family protein [Stieleria maiorica]|uniref:Gfo/Idh/MocA family protein n=1 Tax=Stieleria maiorica TaxID=2795974 RepID=UPI00142F2E55|nr:Gfo/Idh/MocA family oxidoreductase [Stieleria maiorica]